jgi:hypothetical protein
VGRFSAILSPKTFVLCENMKNDNFHELWHFYTLKKETQGDFGPNCNVCKRKISSTFSDSVPQNLNNPDSGYGVGKSCGNFRKTTLNGDQCSGLVGHFSLRPSFSTCYTCSMSQH